jgi:hypothetical protein
VPPPSHRNVWAVLIGADEYADPALPDLSFSGRDARAMLGALTRSFGAGGNGGGGGAAFRRENALLLAAHGDLRPTAANIRFALGTWLPEQAGRGDLAIVFFSGHGWPVKDDSEKDGVKRFLVPSDAKRDLLADTAVSMNEVAEMIAYLPCEHVVTILDACFSGTPGGRSLGASAAAARGDSFWGELASVTGKVVLTASAHDQPSLEVADLESGLFTYYVVEGLSSFGDANSDGILSVGELFVYARDRVRVFAARLGARQEPQAAAVTLSVKDYALCTSARFGAEARDEAAAPPVAGGAVLTPTERESLPELSSALGGGRLVIDNLAPLSYARIIAPDGTDLGSNPVPLSLELPPGEYRVTVGARGRLPVETRVTIKAGEVSALGKIAQRADPAYFVQMPDTEFEELPLVVQQFVEREQQMQQESESGDDASDGENGGGKE